MIKEEVKKIQRLYGESKYQSIVNYISVLLQSIQYYNVYFLTQIAGAYWNMNKMKETWYYINLAESLDSKYAFLIYLKGQIYYYSDDFERSKVEWLRLLEIDVNCIYDLQYGFTKKWSEGLLNDSRFYLANCYYYLGNIIEADKCAKKHLTFRKKRIPSEFQRKDVLSFIRELSFCDYRQYSISEKDYGSSMPDEVKERFEKYVAKLDEFKDKDKIVRYYRRYLKMYPDEYYLWTVFSEYCYDYKMSKECLRAAEMANMICTTRDDMLVVYNYGSALYLNGMYDEAMQEFNYLLSKSLDYIAYNVHGEGMRYAKKLVSNTYKMVEQVKKAQAEV